MLSVCVSPVSTLPGWASTPASNSTRSVRLVLPASTWATMPRLRVLLPARTGLHIHSVGGYLAGREGCSHGGVPFLQEESAGARRLATVRRVATLSHHGNRP